MPGLDDVVDLDASYASTCAVTGAGDLLCWGHLDYGEQLRDMSPTPRCVVVEDPP